MRMRPEPAPYKKTLFDRHGPDAVDFVRSAGFGLAVFGLVMGAATLQMGRMSWGVAEDVYVTNRLVDLLAGPLGDAGRACVELRKLIERYPGSANAQRAREALARLKATLDQ